MRPVPGGARAGEADYAEQRQRDSGECQSAKLRPRDTLWATQRLELRSTALNLTNESLTQPRSTTTGRKAAAVRRPQFSRSDRGASVFEDWRSSRVEKPQLQAILRRAMGGVWIEPADLLSVKRQVGRRFDQNLTKRSFPPLRAAYGRKTTGICRPFRDGR